MSTTRDTILNDIARDVLRLETLETRKSDGLDFHDLAVWSLKDALERAYEAGRRAKHPTRCACPACGRDIEIRPNP